MTRSRSLRLYPINKLAAVVNAMTREGIPEGLALRDTSVSPQEIKSPAARISVAQLLAAYRNALAFSRDPTFAIRLGQSTQITTLGMYGYALLSTPSQRALIDLVLKYHRLMLATAELSFREEADEKTGIWRIEPLVTIATEPELYRFIVEVYLGTVTKLSVDILGRPAIKKDIRVTYKRPHNIPDYEEILQCPVQFEQEHSELRVNTTWIDEPSIKHNEITFRAMQEICAEMLDNMGVEKGIARELLQMLLEGAGRFPTIDTVCQRLGASPRTLRRKLKAEGTSYGALVSETRIRLAKKYLRETVIGVEEIARRIGYSDVSNFRRSFVRSTHVTPTAYRRGARSDTGQ
jgi:AraC-like DNA-binding protein